MRIGIVTVQDSNNFGSFLQAYALQHVLQEMGHEVLFIQSRSAKYIRNIFYHVVPGKHDLLHLPRFVSSNLAGRKKYKQFQNAQKCFRVADTYEQGQFDFVVLGSDEIWNVQTPVFRTPIFYGEKMTPVMAYGVSIGNASFQDMACIPQAYFRRISPILARDMHTQAFLESIHIQAPLVCDPTLLVDKAIFERDYHSPLLDGSPFLLVYSYGLEPRIANAICMFAKKQGLRIYSACFPFPWCDGTFDCTALDFCSILKKAEYVVTSTFHGTIFSILMHKQFISLPQSRKTSDLLNLLKLSDRLVPMEAITEELLCRYLTDHSIDFSVTDAVIEEMRAASLKLLKEGIQSSQSKKHGVM